MMESVPQRFPRSGSLDQALSARKQRREQRHVARAFRRLQLLGANAADASHVAEAETGLHTESDSVQHHRERAHSSVIPSSSCSSPLPLQRATQNSPLALEAEAEEEARWLSGGAGDLFPRAKTSALAQQAAQGRLSFWPCRENDRSISTPTTILQQQPSFDDECVITQFAEAVQDYGPSPERKREQTMIEGAPAFTHLRPPCPHLISSANSNATGSESAGLLPVRRHDSPSCDSSQPLRRAATTKRPKATSTAAGFSRTFTEGSQASRSRRPAAPSQSQAFAAASALGAPRSASLPLKTDHGPQNLLLPACEIRLKMSTASTLVQASNTGPAPSSTQPAPIGTQLASISTHPAPLNNPKLLRARSARHAQSLSSAAGPGLQTRRQQADALRQRDAESSSSSSSARIDEHEPVPLMPRMQRARSAHFAATFGSDPLAPAFSKEDSAESADAASLEKSPTASALEGDSQTCRLNLALAPIEVADPIHEDIWARYGEPWRHRNTRPSVKWSSKKWLEAVTKKLMRSKLEKEGAEAMAALNTAQTNGGRGARRGAKAKLGLPTGTELSRGGLPPSLRSGGGNNRTEVNELKKIDRRRNGTGGSRAAGSGEQSIGHSAPRGVGGGAHTRGDPQRALTKAQHTSFSEWCEETEGGDADAAVYARLPVVCQRDTAAKEGGVVESETQNGREPEAGIGAGTDGRCKTAAQHVARHDLPRAASGEGLSELELRERNAAVPDDSTALEPQNNCKGHSRRPSFSDWGPEEMATQN